MKLGNQKPEQQPETDSEKQPETEEKPEVEPSESDDKIEPVERYVCKDIQRFKMGEFQFENGVLEFVDESEAKRFAKLLDAQPPSVKTRIQRVNVEKAEQIAMAFAKNSSSMTRDVDTSDNSLKG